MQSVNYKQDPPFCIQVELTEGCPLRCKFCGINAIPKDKTEYDFMPVELARIAANKIKDSGWNCRIEFAMHGEPTMNPNRTEIIKIFRDHLPKHNLMMLSNGIGVCRGDVHQNILDLFEAGLNCFAFEEYDNCTAHEKIRKSFENNYIVYPDNGNGNPHRRMKGTRLVFIRNIKNQTKGTHSELCNHCGDGGPLDFFKKK